MLKILVGKESRKIHYPMGEMVLPGSPKISGRMGPKGYFPVFKQNQFGG